ncbi:MAG: hypothetical protein AB7P99_04820 [Vicinamibacterales bacterium]
MNASRRILIEVRANLRRLAGCRRHRFVGGRVKLEMLTKRPRCLNCGGEIELMEIRPYIAGYVAAGGRADDIWPGWDTRHEGSTP